MTFLPYIMALSLGSTFVSGALPIQSTQNGITVQTCIGQTIFIDFGQDAPPSQPPHKTKACHAVCCTKDNEAENEANNDADNN